MITTSEFEGAKLVISSIWKGEFEDSGSTSKSFVALITTSEFEGSELVTSAIWKAVFDSVKLVTPRSSVCSFRLIRIT